VATTIRPSGDRAVPASFGYHPYFRLPGGRHPAWRLLLPRRRHVELDERGIPTGRGTDAPAEAEPIGARTYDDLFELTGDRRLGIQHGGRRLSVLFGAGYPYAQVYAPPGAGFACLEPMTAPTDALVAGATRSCAPASRSRRGSRSAPGASGPGRRSVAAFHLAAARYRVTALPTASSVGAPGPASSSSSSPQSIRAASVRSRTCGPRLLEK
jgi:Aldose 1-epimerase